jgi:hypothetical protein
MRTKKEGRRHNRRLAQWRATCLNSSAMLLLGFSAGVTALFSEIPHERQAQNRYILLLLFCSLGSLAQNNVHIRGHFDGFPSSQYQILVNSPLTLTSAKSILQEKTDLNGCFHTDIRLDSTQKVTIVCLGYRVDFLLSPNDTLSFCNPSRSFSPQVQGNTAKLHQFLYESMLFGKDSLAEKPLFKHISSENYFTIVNDLSAQYWERYQSTCDTTNRYINTYISASLEGQEYLRKQAYLRSQGELSKNDPIRFNILGEEARISELYMEGLQQHLLGMNMGGGMMRGGFFQVDSTFWDKGYANAYESLRKVPLTRELVLAQIVQRTLFTRMSFNGQDFKINQALFRRFKEDFPNSSYIKTLNEAINNFPVRFRPQEPPKK